MADIEVVVSHHERAVVRVGDVFLKIETNPDKSGRERAAMAAVPVPTPELAWYEPPVLALRAVAGAPLHAGSPSAAWAAAGAAARRVHDATPPLGLDTVFVSQQSLGWIDHDRIWFEERDLLEQHVFERHCAISADALATREVEPRFLHGDLQAAHVYVDGDRVTGIIDWGDACIGDPLFDTAVLTGKHLDRLDDVLAGYGDADRNVIRGWWSLRRLGEIRWMVEHG